MSDKNDIEIKILNDLQVGPNLVQELEEQPGYYANWAFIKARSDDLLRSKEEKLDLIFSELYHEYISDNKGAKQEEIKSFIRRHPDYQQAQKFVRKAKYNTDILKSATKAFEQKAFVLQQLASIVKLEKELSHISGSASSEDLLDQNNKHAIEKATNILKKKYQKG